MNFYGSRLEDGKRLDCARVGEHRDFEPGPVASLSLGERALFQFVTPRQGARARARASRRSGSTTARCSSSAATRGRSSALHRVLRVEKKGGFRFDVRVADFETRRVNFTFRYVPREHIAAFAELGEPARQRRARLRRGARALVAVLRARAAAGPIGLIGLADLA